MKLYIILRNGVYIQGVGGVFDSVEKAEVATNDFINNEPDNYHTYTVVPFELNVPSEQVSSNSKYVSGSFVESTPVMVIVKKG